ncbi:GNAT family N-acetyltransferase [Pendulispora brunnea]|uniref:GNAT family N-acetyltransferase n=2 Tax=Pendulispora brunnea TaxID=2905690 RepID=A0ABZ2K828_9BACT
MEPDNPLLDDFVLSLARRSPARVCFVPTASGDFAAYITRFYRAFSRKCLATDLTLFSAGSLPRQPAHTADLPAFLGEQDVIYVGGGSTANLRALWRAHGIDRMLRDAWSAGAVLCGVSAGMLCWFQSSITDSFGGPAPLHDGLAFLEGSACPHYDGEAWRRPTYHRLVASGELPGGYAADDGAALHFTGTSLVGVVSSRPEASAYRVTLHDGQLVEERLPTRFLGAIARRATAAELPLLPAVEAAADERFAAMGYAPLPPPGSSETLAAALFVLVAGEPPVGFARVEVVDGIAHLEQLSVHPVHQGRGFGAALLEGAFQEAQRLGYSEMTLVTFADVPWNAPFYARHGFRELDVLTLGLEALRAKERSLGLDAMGRRVVMKRTTP